MKAKIMILILVLGGALTAALAYRSTVSKQQVNESAPSGADDLRVDDAIYDRFVTAGLARDCDAAFRLARHHAFYTTNYDEAVHWYRIAARCPHVGAKGELIAMLRFSPKDDREVDRLLLEIEHLDPKAAERERDAVRSARASR